MSGETKSSAWTIDSLKEYMESRIACLERADAAILDKMNERDLRYSERAMAQEKAIVKAETAQTEYNVRSNEFRGQLDDQAKTLMPRAEVAVVMRGQDEKIGRLDTDMRDLRESRSAIRGTGEGGRAFRDESRANVALIVGIVAGLVSFSGLLVVLVRTFAGR
jgi:hypothetical protein